MGGAKLNKTSEDGLNDNRTDFCFILLQALDPSFTETGLPREECTDEDSGNG